MELSLNNITNFLVGEGWHKMRDGRVFSEYEPPQKLNLPEGYFLDIPLNDSKRDFQQYAEMLTDILANQIYIGKFTKEDLKITFSNNSFSIVSFRVKDTEYGSIKHPRFVKIVKNLDEILKKTVNFVSTGKQIFGKAPNEVKEYINGCSALPSEKGSYIVKLKIPKRITTKENFSFLNQIEVPDRLFDILKNFVIEFVNTDVSQIDERFCEINKNYINVELLTAIRNLYSDSEINDSDFSFLNTDALRQFEIKNLEIDRFTKNIKKVEEIVLSNNYLEITGKVTLLSSKNVNLNKNKIMVFSEEESIRVKAVLDKEIYRKACDAHEDDCEVRISGIAKQESNSYFIEKVEKFEVL